MMIRKIVKLGLFVSLLLPVVVSAAETITLNGTIRDFYDYNQNNSKNPDFENPNRLPPSGYEIYAVTGLVEDQLGQDRKPILKSKTGQMDDQQHQSIADSNSFSQWYRDVNGINESMPYSITLTKNGNAYEYENHSFFPIDGKLIGNEGPYKGHDHNYHFTYEIHSEFTYQGGETFTFAGDDDVWVFINNELVVDIGGIHVSVEKSVNLDTLGLIRGETYNFDFFFAERHIVGSNFKITTSIELKDSNKPEPFTCSQDAYLFSANAHARDAHTINLSSGEYALQKDNLDYQINATGYNVKDNLIWGYDINTHKVIKIDANYTITSYDVPDLPKEDFYAGDVSLDGILYLKHHGTDKIYKINLNSGEPVYEGDITLTKSENFGDFAFNPVDKMLYAISENDRHLYKIDPQNGQLTDLGENFNENEHEDFHTFVFDVDGNLYFYGLSGKIYKINLSADADAPYEHTLFATIEINFKGGDGARCPNAVVEEASLLTISSGSVTEGNPSDTKEMVFTVNLDKHATEDVTFDYTTADGDDSNDKVNAKAGEDYETVNSDLLIPEGEESGTIRVTVMGDTLVEADEKFTLTLSNIQGALCHDSNLIATGTIIDDDYNQLTAFDAHSGGVSGAKKIKTKIVGQPFILELAEIKDATHYADTFGDLNDTKVGIVENCTEVVSDMNMSALVDFTIPSDQHFVNKEFTLNRAIKIAKVQFYYRDDKGEERASCSGDAFAVRPDKFTLNVPTRKKSAENFSFKIKAVNSNGLESSLAYNETINSSFDINYTDDKVSHALLGDIDFSGITFTDGVASKNVNYSEVGKLNFTISEISGSEFAIIDKDDTPDADRLITQDKKTVEFTAGYLKIENFDLKNMMNNFTYYANKDDIADMHLELNSTITAYSVDDNVLKNYHSGLYAKDSDLTVEFSKESQSNSTLYWADEVDVTNHNGDSSSNGFVFDINSTRFDQGKAKVGIYINFNRDASQEKEPLRFTINKLSVKDSDDINGTKTYSKSTDLYYGRLHTPNYYGEDAKEHKVIINHEVYCKECDKTKFIYANGKASEDNLYWYKLKKSEYGTADGFDNVDAANNPFVDKVKDPTSIVAGTSNVIDYDKVDNIIFDIAKAPLKNRISYEPKPWLIYNRFNPNADKHSFNMEISSSGNWIGKGEQGSTLKGSASRRGSVKMDW